MNAGFRGIDEKTWLEFKALAIIKDKKMGDFLTEVMEERIKLVGKRGASSEEAEP